jgi:hypothetical protein
MVLPSRRDDVLLQPKGVKNVGQLIIDRPSINARAVQVATQKYMVSRWGADCTQNMSEFVIELSRTGQMNSSNL